jgi:hypothetical protein
MGLATLIAFAAVGIWAVLGFPGLTRWWTGPRPGELAARPGTMSTAFPATSGAASATERMARKESP